MSNDPVRPCRYCINPTDEGMVFTCMDPQVHVCADCLLKVLDLAMTGLQDQGYWSNYPNRPY